ncbi:MAG: hypothetical protein ABSD31_06455 [Candidatus Binataceae bacterium]
MSLDYEEEAGVAAAIRLRQSADLRSLVLANRFGEPLDVLGNVAPSRVFVWPELHGQRVFWQCLKLCERRDFPVAVTNDDRYYMRFLFFVPPERRASSILRRAPLNRFRLLAMRFH